MHERRGLRAGQRENHLTCAPAGAALAAEIGTAWATFVRGQLDVRRRWPPDRRARYGETSGLPASMVTMRARNGFSGDQIDIAWQRQKRKCPCCRRSLAHMDYDAHHRDGDRSNNRTANLLLVCVDCHHKCYHNEHRVSRQPINCRVLRVPAFSTTGRRCNCKGCGQCTSQYKRCTTEIRKPYARTCSYCAVG